MKYLSFRLYLSFKMKIKLKIESIPILYHTSTLYQEFYHERKTVVTVPFSRYTSSFETDDIQKMKKNMKIVHYWKFKDIPDEIYTFVIDSLSRGGKEQLVLEMKSWKWFLMGRKEIFFLCQELKRVQSICFYSAQHGFLSLLQYAIRHGYNYNEQVCSVAAQSGHLDCLMELYRNGCPWNEWTCIRAAEKGHFDCLHFAIENGCPVSKEICAYAAENGHLSILEYAQSIELPWDEVTMFQTADNGFVEIMEWCHQHGCPVDERASLYAVEKNHVDCLEYALEHNFPMHYAKCLRVAKRKRHDTCIEKIEAHMKSIRIQEKKPIRIMIQKLSGIKLDEENVT